ncbi:MAG: flagellar assembly protein FliX [Alphaproteobacteria bacterium]
MIKVGGSGSTKSVGSSKKSSKSSSASGSSFASLLSVDDEMEETSFVESSSVLTGVNAIFAAQTVEDATDEKARRKLIQRGEAILDSLDDIREGLLKGSIPKDKLIELAQIIRNKREQISDSRLAAILDEIELRAEVEIAKLSRK